MTPEVLETLEFPEALARVAAHAAGPLGAASISARQPSSDAADIRSALAQVADLHQAEVGGEPGHAKAAEVRGKRRHLRVDLGERLRVGNTLLLNGTVHSPPYDIVAIGAGRDRFDADPLVHQLHEDADAFGLRFSMKAPMPSCASNLSIFSTMIDAVSL